jgi:lysophospholipase L1-like esterase
VEVEQSYPALLAQGLGAEVVNAGVPAMKPQTIAAWAQQNAARYSASLVIFARRPDWSSPDGWRGYIQSIRQVQRAVAPARLAVVLPPVSSFDVRGSQQYQSEAEGARRELPQVPLLDLTDTFRAAQAGLPGVMLRQSGGRQQMVEQPSGRVVVDAAAPPEGGLAPEMIAAFEAEHDLVEPLFFDGGHPDAAGFELYAEAVAKWLKGAGLR